MFGIFDNFDGSQTRNAMQTGLRFANNGINRAQRTGRESINRGYRQGRQDINPYLQSGRRGQGFYDDLLGLNGADARDSRQQYLMGDAAFTGKLGQDQNAMLRAMNARGLSGSGRGLLAAERVFQQNYGDIMNRYNNRAQQGAQMAQFGANMANNRGLQNANLGMQAAGMRSGNIMNTYNQKAGTYDAGMNNLLGLVGAGTKIAGLF